MPGDAASRSGCARVLASTALTAFVVAQTIMIRLSRDEQGRLPFNTLAANFANELTKLIAACALWWFNDRNKEYNGLAGLNVYHFCLFAIPGLIYAVQNTLVFYALVYLEAPTFQIFASLKIVTTAVLFRAVLGKILTLVQWVALAQLFLSMVVTKMGPLLHSGHAEEKQNMVIGGSILLVNSCLSATSGIMNEWLVKYQDERAPLMIKSIQLYIWGTVINLIAWIATAGGGGAENSPVGLMGFTPLVWLIVLNNAAVGLSVSFILKYADNIVKCFSTAAAVFISAWMSSLLFGFPIDLPFLIGLCIYTTAFFLYFGAHNPALRNAGFDDSDALPCLFAARALGACGLLGAPSSSASEAEMKQVSGSLGGDSGSNDGVLGGDTKLELSALLGRVDDTGSDGGSG